MANIPIGTKGEERLLVTSEVAIDFLGVENARVLQRDRFRRSLLQSNAEMTPRHLRKFCELDAPSRRILDQAVNRLGLSARAYDRILKVSRTIADLAGSERIESAHAAEAVHYRALDKAYFRAG